MGGKVFKTKYKNIYLNRKGTFHFSFRSRGENYFRSGYYSLETAFKDREMFIGARDFLINRRKYRENMSLGLLVSDCDKHLLFEHKFGLGEDGYPRTQINYKKKRLHKIILSEPNKFVDHINRDKLDNRRENLRYCTKHQNNRNATLRSDNTSGHKGVSFFKRGVNKPWCAYIYYNKRGKHLGYFSTKEEAIKTRQEKAKELFGEFYNG